MLWKMQRMFSGRTHLALSGAILLCGTFVWNSAVPTAAAEPNEQTASDEALELAESALRIGITGDTDERNRMLRKALTRDPECQLARWSLGQFRNENGKWIDALHDGNPSDGKLEEYSKLRERTRKEQLSPLRLASWCRAQGMKDVERYHLREVLQHPNSSDRDRAKAIRQLGLVLHEGQLVARDALEQQKQQTRRQAKADRQWAPRVRRWRDELSSDSERRRTHAASQLKSSAAVEAIPSYERLLVPAGNAHALATVDALAELKPVEATHALVRIALMAEPASVREVAIEKLQLRPMHDYVPQLLTLLESPTQFDYAVTQDVFGNIASQHRLAKAGRNEDHVIERSNFRTPDAGPVVNRITHRVRFNRTYATTPTRARFADAFWRYYTDRSDGNLEELDDRYRDYRMREAARQIIAFEEMAKIQKVQQIVNQQNQAVAWRNQRVHDVLSRTTQANIVDQDPVNWWTWWSDYNELNRGPRQTYRYNEWRSDPVLTEVIRITSCFPAGTHVLTEGGTRAIEEILPGDRVVSQDVESGELALHVVTATTTRPASPTVQVVCGVHRVTTTLGHPFWVNNVGWRMAKKLEPGQRIHTLGGSATVTEVIPSAPLEAHNLIVEETGNYFVGRDLLLLAHDNTLRSPSLAATPGLLLDDK